MAHRNDRRWLFAETRECLAYSSWVASMNVAISMACFIGFDTMFPEVMGQSAVNTIVNPYIYISGFSQL